MLGSHHGWNWNGTSWVYLAIVPDVWSPMHDLWTEQAVKKKYDQMAASTEGVAADAFIDHWRTCNHCDALEALCSIGCQLFGALAHKHHVWCRQLQRANQDGSDPRVLYAA